jgi:hypothetical protein
MFKSLNSNTTGAISGAGTANQSGAPNFLSRFLVGFKVQYVLSCATDVSDST